MRALITALVCAAVLAGPAMESPRAAELRFAYQSDVASLDPHVLNSIFTLGFLSNVYEGLTRRDAQMEIQPALATEWERVEPTRWRFHLRRGVTFHDGSDFTAEDVVFSFERATAPESGVDAKLPDGARFVAVDPYTVDVVTEKPEPILPAALHELLIIDSGWAAAHDAETPGTGGAATSANGTGPYEIVSRAPDERTVFRRNDAYWGETPGNVDRAVFTPLASDATRLAALLSGEVDLAFPLPPQTVARLRGREDVRALTRPGLRTMFLGMDQLSDKLRHGDAGGSNPFKDRRVREAVYRAIDIEAIRAKVMRGHATPTGAMISPAVEPAAAGIERLAYDPEKARALLDAAGYPDGFRVRLDCPNDRYIKDEAVCEAIAGMLAKVGIDVDVDAQPKAKFFQRILSYDTSFYLLGWFPTTMDALIVLDRLAVCPDPDDRARKARFNFGGYCNPEVDRLTEIVRRETDPAARQQAMEKALRLVHADRGYVPLYQQPVIWGARASVEVEPRPDNKIKLAEISVAPAR